MSFRTILFGTAMMSSVRILRLVAQFVAIPILSRLLTPAEYGLVAIAMPFALFAMMIADAGIGMSLVRTPATQRLAWSTSFWLCCLLGLVFGGIMILISPLAANLFHEPQLQPMIIALSFVVLAQAIHLIPVAALQQAQRFRTIALVEILATMAGIVTAVYMAYHNYGAWALIGQQIAFFAVRVLFMVACSPFRPLLQFNWGEVREHVLFGRNVLGNSLITYFSRSFDNWVVGKVLSAALLGFYAMAFQFARLPIMVVAGPLQYVMYAQLAKMKDDKASIARAYLLATRMLAVLIFPLMGMIAVAHEPVFTLLLSSKWADAGIIFMILAPACAVQAVTAISETAIYALGRSDLQLHTAFEYSLIWVIALLFSVTHGLEAAAMAFSACTLLYQLRYLILVLKLMGLNLRDYFETYLIPLIGTGLGIAAYQTVVASELMADWVHVMLAAVIGIAVLMFSVLIQKRALIDQLRNWNMQPSSDAELPVDAGIN